MRNDPESIFNFPDADDKPVSQPYGYVITDGEPTPHLLAHSNSDGTVTVLGPLGKPLIVPDYFKSLTVHVSSAAAAFNKLSDTFEQSFLKLNPFTYNLKHVSDDSWKSLSGQWNEPWHTEYKSSSDG